MHVHVHCGEGEAKFWLDPEVQLAKNYKLSPQQLRQIQQIIEERLDELTSAWRRHFSG